VHLDGDIISTYIIVGMGSAGALHPGFGLPSVAEADERETE
jgi:hypothetical protein